jgi:HAD superfamily hydrolase (TIGR01509 family)
VRGFVFDLDGTLLENIPFHVEAFSTFLARHELPPLTEELRAKIDGKRNRDVFPLVFGRELPEDECARLADEKEAIYRQLSQGRIAPRRGLLRLLDRLSARGLPVALATSAPEANIEHTLRELGLRERFSQIARSDTLGRGKPYPDVFLAAARLITIPPTECIAFEDAPSGIVAAQAAGMMCVAVGLTHSAEMLAAHGARPDIVVADFEEYLAGPGRWLLD